MFSEVLIASAGEYGDMPEENEKELLGRFVNTFTYKYNPSRDFGSNREFYNDLKEALEADEAYAAKPTLLKLLAITQVVMNSWEKDAYTASRRARARLSARVQSLPPTPTTLSAHAPTLLGTPTTSKHQWTSTVRDVVAPTTSATSASKGMSQAGTTKAFALIRRSTRR